MPANRHRSARGATAHVQPAGAIADEGTTPSAEVAFEHPEQVGHLDGIPHDVIGMLAYGIVMLVAATVIAYLAVGIVAAGVAAVVIAALMLRFLPRRARRERRQEAILAVRPHVEEPPRH